VLWLAKGLGAGGAERVILLSARRRDAARVTGRVAYLLPHKDALVADIEAEGIPTACLGGRRAWDLRWLLRLRRDLQRSPVDVVHAHAPVPAVGARLVVRSLPRDRRPAMVTTFHSVWSSKHRATRALDRLTARFDDAEVAVSEAVRRSMPPALAGRAEVVLHGVDVDEVEAAAEGARSAVRAELDLGDDDVVVVTAANLRRQKAYPDLLAAARIVVDRLPSVRFVTLGQGPLADELAARHQRSGLGDRFLLLGYRDDPVRIAAAGDLACLSSVAEGFPLALVEAAVLGLPTVATDVGGVPEVVVDGETGVLVPAGRPDLLAEAIVALASDPERRRELGAAAARRGRSISIRAAVGRCEAIYAQVAREEARR
jgi:glycosyltransferase involved in cell wall biosynthesis